MLPPVMVSTASAAMTASQSARMGPRPSTKMRISTAKAPSVRRPVVERHRGRLEGGANRQEPDRHQQAGRHAAFSERSRDRLQMGTAGQPKGPADAEEQDGARERSEQEVLQAALVAIAIRLVETGHDVRGHHHQLEAQEERDQVTRRGEHAHPQQAEEEHSVELAERQAPGAQVRGREERRQDPDHHRGALEEDRQVVDLVEAAQQRAVRAPHQRARDPRQDQAKDGERRQDPLVVASQEQVCRDHTSTNTARISSGSSGKSSVM